MGSHVQLGVADTIGTVAVGTKGVSVDGASVWVGVGTGVDVALGMIVLVFLARLVGVRLAGTLVLVRNGTGDSVGVLNGKLVSVGVTDSVGQQQSTITSQIQCTSG